MKKKGIIKDQAKEKLLIENEFIIKDFENYNDNLLEGEELKKVMIEEDLGKKEFNHIDKLNGFDDEFNKYILKTTKKEEENFNTNINGNENHKTDSNVNSNCENNKININSRMEFLKQHVRGITDNRIQNLAITIDKVMHVLLLLKSDSPPLIPLEKDEIFDFLYEGNDSIRGILFKNFKALSKNSNYQSISD